MDGNTPAYAGKTATVRVEIPFCGETPPLTRGRPDELVFEGDRDGNTPAYAGKTVCEQEGNGRHEKHPRLRGEDKVPRLRKFGV